MKELRKKKLYVVMDVLCVLVGELWTLFIDVLRFSGRYDLCASVRTFLPAARRVCVFCSHDGSSGITTTPSCLFIYAAESQ